MKNFKEINLNNNSTYVNTDRIKNEFYVQVQKENKKRFVKLKNGESVGAYTNINTIYLEVIGMNHSKICNLVIQVLCSTICIDS